MTDDFDQNDETQTHIPLAKGIMVSHYRIAERIGAGGMGEVYLADDTQLDRKVALKFLAPLLCQDADCRARFKREAKAAAKLNHPNIVTIHEVSEHNDRPYIVMEYVEGDSLKEHILKGDVISENIINSTIPVCEGLQAAHEAGIVHRDIKPANILVDKSRRPRIVDFGLAAVVGGEQITKAGSTMGTVGYMSPEQIADREADHRSDLFSTGVILYELFTGHSPFRKGTEAATMNAIVHEMPDVPSRYNQDISAELDRAILKLLEKDPERRYQSAAELTGDLKKIAASLKRAGEEMPQSAKLLPSIAVLPFTNLSADPEQEYFCDGMAEEIINALTHIESLRVVARTSCFAFKGKHEDIREIGRKLNVETLLEGSVRKVGNRLRVTAQLVKVSDGYHIWSERYDRDMEDVFSVQDEISLAIVDRLKVKLLGGEQAEVVKRSTDNLEAYSLYLKGRYFWNKRSRESYEKAIDCFEKAIEIDPNYAHAYAGIAECYNDLPNYSIVPPSQAYPLAKKAVMKALEINDELAEAHSALGLIKSDHEWDWEGAEKEFKRAIELNPAYETAHHWYALLLAYMGRNEEAVAEGRRAHELDPLSMGINRNLGGIYYFAHRYEDAIELFKRVIEMDPNFPFTHFFMGITYMRTLEFEKAVEALKKERDFTGGVNPVVVLALGTAYVRMGDREKAEEILAGIEERMKHEYISLFYLAQLYFALDRIDEGFDLLEKAYTERDIFLRFIKAMPMEEVVLEDPRFAALLKKMRLD